MSLNPKASQCLHWQVSFPNLTEASLLGPWPGTTALSTTQNHRPHFVKGPKKYLLAQLVISNFCKILFWSNLKTVSPNLLIDKIIVPQFLHYLNLHHTIPARKTLIQAPASLSFYFLRVTRNLKYRKPNCFFFNAKNITYPFRPPLVLKK